MFESGLMKLYFFRGYAPNFGDELNTWLLPKVFPDFFDEDDRKLFLGIGSIINDLHPKDSQKIVFGSGYGGYCPLPVLNETWSIYCVRGPRTAEAMGLGPEKVAGDTAILVSRFRDKPVSKSFPCSFMPHWESVERGNWSLACQLAGVHYIDPTRSVEEVLAAIEASQMLVTEAMHGAIVADALRVPWVPILPFHKSHRMKWFDWAAAIDTNLSHNRIWPSSTQEAWVAQTQRRGKGFQTPPLALQTIVKVADWSFLQLAASSLRRASRVEPRLSPDVAMARALDRLESFATQIRRDF